MKARYPAKSVSKENVLEAISDYESLRILNSLAKEGKSVEGLMQKLQLTRKQYYTRLRRLLNAGLIKRKNNAYSLTTFGNIIFEFQSILKHVIDNRSKLNKNGVQYSFEEKRIMNKLISGHRHSANRLFNLSTAIVLATVNLIGRVDLNF